MHSEEVTVGGAPIDPAAVHGVVTNNFVATAATPARCSPQTHMKANHFGPDMADALAEYMAAQSPVTPMVER